MRNLSGTGISAGVPEVYGAIWTRNDGSDGSMSLIVNHSGVFSDTEDHPNYTYTRLAENSGTYSGSVNRLYASNYNSLYGARSTIQPAARAVYYIIKT